MPFGDGCYRILVFVSLYANIVDMQKLNWRKRRQQLPNSFRYRFSVNNGQNERMYTRQNTPIFLVDTLKVECHYVCMASNNKKKTSKKWLSRCCLWSLRWCEWWFVCFVFCSNLKKNLFDAISKALYGEKGKNGIFNGKFMVNLPLYVSLKRPKKQFSHFFSLLLLTVLLRLFKNWLI